MKQLAVTSQHLVVLVFFNARDIFLYSLKYSDTVKPPLISNLKIKTFVCAVVVVFNNNKRSFVQFFPFSACFAFVCTAGTKIVVTVHVQDPKSTFR